MDWFGEFKWFWVIINVNYAKWVFGYVVWPLTPTSRLGEGRNTWDSLARVCACPADLDSTSLTHHPTRSAILIVVGLLRVDTDGTVIFPSHMIFFDLTTNSRGINQIYEGCAVTDKTLICYKGDFKPIQTNKPQIIKDKTSGNLVGNI